VTFDRIWGSEGRCRDFDRAFYPLRSHEKDRWLSIAVAREIGIGLPPVELVQVGDVYFVQDGHHRISVARMQGQKAVDAGVKDLTGLASRDYCAADKLWMVLHRLTGSSENLSGLDGSYGGRRSQRQSEWPNNCAPSLETGRL